MFSISFVSAIRRPVVFEGGGGGWSESICDTSQAICSSASCGYQWISSGETNGSGSSSDYYDWSILTTPFINPTANSPSGLGVDNQGNVFFTSYSKHALYKCDKDLVSCSVVFGTYNIPGGDNTHLRNPEGLAIDKWNNTILVSDSGNNRILRINNAAGNYAVLDSLAFTGVKDISSDSKGNAFFVAASKVYKYDYYLFSELAQFDFVSFPGYDASKPLHGVSVGSDNLLFGTDSVLAAGYGMNKVFQLNNDLNVILREYGNGTPNANGLYWPTGIDFDWTGNKYIAEYGGDRVMKFSPDFSSKIKTFGVYDTCVQDSTHLCGAFKVRSTRYGLYATDRNNNRIILLKKMTSCCGNGSYEFPISFNSFPGACDDTGTCNQTTPNAICCNTGAGECSFNSQCYSVNDVENIDYLNYPNLNTRYDRFAVCDYGWKDGDYSKNACGKIETKNNFKNCSGEDCWLAEGETGNFAEYGDAFGGEGEGAGIFDKYGSYPVSTNAVTECCGDDSYEYAIRNVNNPNEMACCSNPNDIVVNGQCVVPNTITNQTICGEVFGECSSIGKDVFCGDNSPETIKSFDSFSGACDEPGNCNDSNSLDIACCNDGGDCVYQGACFSGGQVKSIDGTNSGYAMCNAGKWYDADVSYDVCLAAENQYNFPGCTGTDCWVSEGELSPFGEYGDNLGGEYDSGSPNSSEIYDFMPQYDVQNSQLQECCGDDSGEFYKTNGTQRACCDSPNDTVVGGECVPQNISIRDEYFLKRCVNEDNLSYCASISNAAKKNNSYLQYALQYNNSSICNSIAGNPSMQNYCIQKVALFQTQGALTDSINPTISITSASTGVPCHPYTLTGTATDNFGATNVSYSINWGGILNDSNGYVDYGNFSKQLQLSPGGNTIRVTITDAAGNYSQDTKTIFCPNILTLDQTWTGFSSSVSGIAVDNSGFVYLSEKNNFRILKLNPSNGSIVQTFNLIGQTPADSGIQLKPLGLDVDAWGNIYFAYEFAGGQTVGNAYGGVYKISSSGAFIRHLGSYDSAETTKFLRNPKDIDLAKRADGYVSMLVVADDDGGNTNLKRFAVIPSTGVPYDYFAVNDETTGGVFYAAALDNYLGHIVYASDWANSKVFFKGNQSITQIGPGIFGKFYYDPAGIEIDAPNNLLVVADGIGITMKIHFFNAVTRQFIAKQYITPIGLDGIIAIYGDYLYYTESPTGKIYKYSINRSAFT
ncbi:MAG: hypothetical protein Q7S21_01650 [archaeon]|nr:hypothetical protein [archaeon]